MSELFFTVKMVFIAFFIVVFMQIRVDNVSIEEHASEFVHTSPAILFMREVAEGGLAVMHDVWSKTTAGIKTKYWTKFDEKNQPGKRQMAFAVDRSKEFIAEQQAKAAAELERQKMAAAEAKKKLGERSNKVKNFFGFGGDDNEPSESSSKKASSNEKSSGEDSPDSESVE